MYLAQLSALQTQTPFYIKTLECIITGNASPESKEKIDTAITEAISIANGEKNAFSIDNSHYFFISTLLSKYKEKLTKIQINNYQTEVYKDILEVLI